MNETTKADQGTNDEATKELTWAANWGATRMHAFRPGSSHSLCSRVKALGAWADDVPYRRSRIAAGLPACTLCVKLAKAPSTPTE